MSTLTKVFIVLLVLFSVVFTTMTIAVVAQTPNWKGVADKYEERARIADATLRNAHAAAAARLASARDDVERNQQRIAELEKQLQEASGSAARLRSDLAKSEADRGSTEAMNRALLAQVELSRDAETKLREQLNKIDRENIDVQQRNVDLNGRVNELTAQVAVLNEQRRQYEQQLNIMKQDLDKISQATGRPSSARSFEDPTGVAMPNVQSLTRVKPSAIRGKVTAIAGDRVSINVGTGDGVNRDMRFVIHRGDKYVGDLKVSDVEPGQAAGRIISSVTSPQVGDTVVDAMSIAAGK